MTANSERILREWEQRNPTPKVSTQINPWIGVDLDGTLAEHMKEWTGAIEAPVWPMVYRVRRWLADGKDVRILTARVARCVPDRHIQYLNIRNWTFEMFGQYLDVTSEKDPGMTELWDDRAIQVERNTGRRVDGKSD